MAEPKTLVEQLRESAEILSMRQSEHVEQFLIAPADHEALDAAQLMGEAASEIERLLTGDVTVTDEILERARDEISRQSQAQEGREDILEKLAGDKTLEWIEGYFDVRKILEAAALQSASPSMEKELVDMLRKIIKADDAAVAEMEALGLDVNNEIVALTEEAREVLKRFDTIHKPGGEK